MSRKKGERKEKVQGCVRPRSAFLLKALVPLVGESHPGDVINIALERWFQEPHVAALIEHHKLDQRIT